MVKLLKRFFAFIIGVITLKSLNEFLRYNKFSDIFKEADGMLSLMRFLNFMLTMIPITVWAIISLHSWTLVVIPESVVVLMVAGLTGKVAQRFLEGKEDRGIENAPPQ